MPSLRLPIACVAVACASCNSSTTAPTTTSTTTPTATTAPAPSTAFQPTISFTGGDTFVVGQTGQLTATERDSATAAAQDVTSSATWTSSNPTVATVSATGFVTARALGSTIIKANDTTASGSLLLSVVSKVVTGLLVVGPSTIPTGQASQLTASATTADGSEVVTAGVVWQSANPNVAAVTDAGLLIANSAGTTTITATYQGAVGRLTVTVADVTVTSISFYGSVSVSQGLTTQLTAIATLADGSSRIVTNFATWQSLNTSIATVSSTGLVTALTTAGVVTITATYLGTTGSVAITVN